MWKPSSAVWVRVGTAFVALPLVLALVWVPRLHAGFTIFIGILAAIGLYEYYAIVRARAISPETIGATVSGTLVVLAGHAYSLAFVNLMLLCGLVMVSALHVARGQRSVAGLSSSAFGVLYVGWMGAHITLLRGVPGVGPGLVTLLLAVISLSDTGAYLFGSLLGRHKLAPKASPNKTWEGAVAGVFAGILGALAVYALRNAFGWRFLPDWTAVSYVYAGLVLSVVGQVGDLAESCLKRDAGIKDSGVFFPGHGGVLDRCDGFLFAAPILYYMATPLWLN